MEPIQKTRFGSGKSFARWILLSLLVYVLVLPGCGILSPKTPSESSKTNETTGNNLPRGKTHSKWHLSARTQHTFAEVGSDTDPAVSPDGKWLYFVSNRNNNNFDLYRKSLKQKRPVQRLTTSRCDERLPAVSPLNTQEIAVARNKSGNWDIWIFHPGREKKWEQITDLASEEAWPSWSPDGRKLAYCQYLDGRKKWKTWIRDLTTGRTSEVGTGYWPDWNPREPRKIALIDHRRRDPNMFFLETFTLPSTRRYQVQQSRDWAVSSPSWSPNGSYIVFASVLKSKQSRSENRFWKGDDIWMVRENGTELTQLTNTPEPEWFPVWGPDNRIYYLKKRNGITNIYSVPGPEEGIKMKKESY